MIASWMVYALLVSILVAAGAWAAQLHEEILVFNSGFWRKDHELWMDVQKADWADVILKENFKKFWMESVANAFADDLNEIRKV